MTRNRSSQSRQGVTGSRNGLSSSGGGNARNARNSAAGSRGGTNNGFVNAGYNNGSRKSRAAEYQRVERREADARKKWQQEQERRRREEEAAAKKERDEAEKRRKKAERRDRRAESAAQMLGHIRQFVLMFVIAVLLCVIGGYMYLNAALIRNMLGGASVVYVLGSEITREEARAVAPNYEYFKRRYFSEGSHLWSYDADDVYINDDWYVNFSLIGSYYGFVVTGDAGEYSFITQIGSDNRASVYGDVVRFHVGTSVALINGIEVRLPKPVVVKNGDIWVPYEFINYYVSDMSATYNSSLSTMSLTPLSGKPASSDNPLHLTLKQESYAPHIAESSLSEEILEQTDPVRIRAEREAKKRRAAEEAAAAARAEEEAAAAALIPDISFDDLVE